MSDVEFDRDGFERLQLKAQEYEAKLRERLGKFNINECFALG